MKDFNFIKAQNLEEVSRMLLVHHPHACILAGGTDLLVQLHEKSGRWDELEAVIDLHPFQEELSRIEDVGDALRIGALCTQTIGHIPEDRLNMGVINQFFVFENTSFYNYKTDEFSSTRNSINWKKEHLYSGELIKKYNVKAPSEDVALATLSGGNQQKLVPRLRAGRSQRRAEVGRLHRRAHAHG